MLAYMKYAYTHRHVCSILGHILQYEINRLYDNSKFQFLINCHTIFYSSCTMLHFHQPCTSIPVSSYPHQHIWSILFVYNNYSNEREVLSCAISLNFINYQWYRAFYMSLFAICRSSLEKHQFRFFAHF